MVIGHGFERKSQRWGRDSSTIEKQLPKFSIIVPVKDEESVISRCIEALLSQKYPKKQMEIIVVDGDSKDDSKKICEEYAHKNPGLIRVVTQTGNKGKPSALNDGLRLVTGNIVGVFDADNVPDEDALITAAECFEDQSVEALQGVTVSINEDQNYLTKIASYEEKVWFRTIWCRDNLRLFVSLTGSCQFIRYETLIGLGAWEEDCLAEDVDLALRLTETGRLVKYEAGVRSWQETPSTFRDLFQQRTRWYAGYLENLLRYGRLLRKPSKKSIDAEITLFGPLIMAISSIVFFASLFQLVILRGETIFPSMSSLGLTSLTLLLVGLSLAFIDKPFRLSKLILVPFLYLYWILQSFIACWALIQLLFKRPMAWRKTAKDGTVTKSSFLDEKT